VTTVAVAAAGAGVVVVTVRGCLDEEAAPATQQKMTTQMTMGITTKSAITPTVTPTIMPTMLTTPRRLENVWYSNCLSCRRMFSLSVEIYKTICENPEAGRRSFSFQPQTMDSTAYCASSSLMMCVTYKHVSHMPATFKPPSHVPCPSTL